MQNLLGITDSAGQSERRAGRVGANQVSVRVELQACKSAPRVPSAIPSARGSRFELAFQMLCQLRDGGVVEQLGQIDESGEVPVDAFVDFDQFE